MVFPQKNYNVVLKCVQGLYGLQNSDLSPRLWVAWRKSLKRMFEDGITVNEILSAIYEARDLKLWPQGTRYWHRVKDVVLKNRRATYRTTRTDAGPVRIMDLLKHRFSVRSG